MKCFTFKLNFSFITLPPNIRLHNDKHNKSLREYNKNLSEEEIFFPLAKGQS